MELDIEQFGQAIADAMMKPKDEWDDYCPIIENGKTIDVYLTEIIEAPSEYNRLYHKILSASKGTKINLHINNGGGVIDSAVMITDAITRSAATVKAHLSGTVASAATLITMECDDIYVAPYTQFLIHNYSGGVHGKGKEAKDQMDFVNEEIGNTFKQAYGGFLTEAEIGTVIEDKDFWMGKDEILKRWEGRKAFLREQQE